MLGGAREIVNQALGADEKGNIKEAVRLYVSAVEFCQSAVS